MMTPGSSYQADVEIKSPMGWIKVEALLLISSETAFSGQAKLLGFSVELTDCAREGDHLRFAASPKLPFGVLRVEIEADVAPDGAVTGVANAPRHKPMEIRGKLSPAESAQ